jgi:hypothetical protein
VKKLRIVIVFAIKVTTDLLNVGLTPFKSGNTLPAIYLGYQAFPVSDHFLFSPMYLSGVAFYAMIFIKHRPPITISSGSIHRKSRACTENEKKHAFKPISTHFNLLFDVID